MKEYKQFPNSSNIRAGHWDPETGTIKIEFNSGAIYEYEQCTLDEWKAIATAHSTGRAVNVVLVKGKKPYKKIFP